MFNPQARWDRPLPQQSNSAKDSISVSAFFDKAKITPRFFVLRNRLYKVKKINFFWQEKQGEILLSVFSVETTGGCFQISFNSKSFAWKLDKIID